MEYQGFTEKRRLKVVQENYDLVVVGGGLTGVCCAITAARTGIKVVLLQYWAAMLRVKSAFGHWEPLPIWEIIIVGLVREE